MLFIDYYPIVWAVEHTPSNPCNFLFVLRLHTNYLQIYKLHWSLCYSYYERILWSPKLARRRGDDNDGDKQSLHPNVFGTSKFGIETKRSVAHLTNHWRAKQNFIYEKKNRWKTNQNSAHKKCMINSDRSVCRIWRRYEWCAVAVAVVVRLAAFVCVSAMLHNNSQLTH